ncbi:helix-turn-helix domain-containing protein [Rugosimonospora africana]|uniref:HTH cro/C1-type domain-containing protein n=1 Tax=Rugosimonospora africana TaxID=556532 RepID=A0A8J3R1P8_9ACTN|nr:helix-turn-helix transcriptional regulator [Rugosimonospora africana]GIH20868.1 hypothetical protein Raf01_90400 [Rugosimonospora africana]
MSRDGELVHGGARRLGLLEQSQLAQASGMTQSAVPRFEAGGTVPTLPVLERLAAALGVGLTVKFESRDAA